MNATERYMRLRGDGRNVTRYRVSKENAAVHLYLDVRGEHTVADLLAALTEQGAQPEEVTFRGGCFVITQPATPEDVQLWERGDVERAVRAIQSRREWYERLRAEFDTQPGAAS